MTPATTRSQPGRWAAAVACIVAAVALLAAVAWIGGQLVDIPQPSAATTDETRLADFRDATYYPVRDLVAGGDPYDPQAMLTTWPVRQEFGLYAPFHLLLHAPWGLAPYRAAALGYAAVMTIATVALVAMAIRQAPSRWRPAWLLGGSALLLASYVGEVNVYLGQVNPLVALGVAGALVWRRSRPWLAAVLLALAWLKPQFGIPMTVLLIAAGSWRVAGAGTGLAGLASLPVVGVLVAREGGTAGFADVVRRNVEFSRGTSYGATDSMTATRIDVVPVAVRLSGESSLAAAELAVFVAVLGAGALLVARRRGAPPELVDLSVLCITLVCVVHQPGDLLVIVPAAVAGVVALVPRWAGRVRLTGSDKVPAGLPPGPARPLLAAGLGLLAVPFAHQGAVDAALVGLAGPRAAATVDGVLVVAATVAVGLALAVSSNGPAAVRRPVPVPA